MSAPKKLSVGRGSNLRITKEGKRVQARFKVLVEIALVSLGATQTPSGRREWSIETRYGVLHLTPYGDWIAGLFDDWERAKVRFDHWKWNHHYDEGAAEPAVEDFRRKLKALLPETEAAS